MKIILIPLKTKHPKSVYHIVIRFMSGDGDHYEKETVKCSSEEDFLEKVKILSDRKAYKRKYHNAAIDDNDAWCREHEQWLDAPYDVTQPGMGYRAQLDNYECFYFDIHGIKFGVKLEED